MTPSGAAVHVLLAIGVGVEVASVLGLLLMHNAFDRLHYLGPAAIAGPPFIAAAIVVREGHSGAGIKAVLIALILMLMSPAVAHAVSRAIRIREFGHWVVMPEERPGARDSRPGPDRRP
ncbi:MAG: monovalent cation/H(+) antiporter subunit G [Candidatus Dormibacteraceae bacterium]